MSGHTPGPWKVDTITEKKSGYRVISIKAADGYIANIVMNCADNERANARLIAEAPAMLDALREAAIRCERRVDHELILSHINVALAAFQPKVPA